MDEKNKIYLKSLFAGIAGITALGLFYFILLTWVGGDWHHPWQQFLVIKYWMSALFLGFGLQVGLFWYVRLMVRKRNAQRVATANAGISTATMVACCAHHIVDFVPILGLSALTIFLAKYQVYFLAIGITSNFFGIFYMFRVINKYKLLRLTPQNI